MSVFMHVALAKGLTWASITKSDLTQINRTIQTQSAGAIDTRYNLHHTWINSGYKKALKLAGKVKNFNGYKYTLKFYINGFNDEHVIIKFSPPTTQTFKPLYPGFIVKYYNKNFIVSKYAYQKNDFRKLPPVGSQLIQCNGMNARNLMLNDIFPFSGNPKIEADWVSSTPSLFINSGNPFNKKLKSCTFVFQKKKKKFDLTWYPLPKFFDLRKAAWPYTPKFSVRLFSNDQGLWANIPTFSAKTPSITQHLKKLVLSSKDWRKYKYIILDLRGNGGGNSAWGEKILEGIYGFKYFNWIQNQHPDHSYQLWRATKENYTFLITEGLPFLANSVGKKSSEYQLLKQISTDMKSKLKKTKPGYVRQKSKPLKKHTASTSPPVQLTSAKIVVVVDGRCGSSCLTFVGQAVKIPNLLLMGKQTHADTVYTELRHQKLKSTFAKVGFPIAVHYLRTRKNNQPYDPVFSYSGDINNTKMLQKWILQHIK